MSHPDLSDLENDYIEAQRAAVLEIADQGLISLARLVDSGAIDVAPKFQRRDRWAADRQSLLIESFMTNIPVPPVYLAEDGNRLGFYAVIDGKQRLTAISLFFSDRLVLRSLSRLEGLNGLRYSQMPAGIRNSLGMKNLRVTTLLRQSNEDLKHEVFLRLNTGGEVLNGQEIRNVAYRGPLNDLIYELCESEFLRRQFKIVPPSSPAFRRMSDAEYVLRFLTLSARWHSFQGQLAKEMDRFMWANRDSSPKYLSRYRASFEEALTCAEAIWSDRAFKWPGRDQAISGLFDAQMIALSELTPRQQAQAIRDAAKIRSKTEKLFADPEFEEAVRQGTNTPARLRKRTLDMKAALSEVIGD